jgi:hypothetical protein
MTDQITDPELRAAVTRRVPMAFLQPVSTKQCGWALYDDRVNVGDGNDLALAPLSECPANGFGGQPRKSAMSE